MKTIWVVVADASRARIFQTDRNFTELYEAETLAHPQSRLHEQELTSDLPGRSFDSEGEGRHAMGQAVGPKKKATMDFAQAIGNRINTACHAGKCNALIVIAAPAFLGLLRDSLDKSATKNIVVEIDKDLTQHSVEEIRNHLPKHV